MRTKLTFAFLLLIWGTVAIADGGEGVAAQILADGLIQFDPPQAVSCVAVRVEVPTDKMITGLRWFSGSSSIAFPRVLVASGNDYWPPSYDQAVTVAENALGAEQGWSELTFDMPVASQSGTLFVLLEYPENYAPVNGQSALGVGYADIASPRRYFVTGDGQTWIKVVSNCRVLLEPVVADRLPGVPDKRFPTDNPPSAPIDRTGLFASPNPFNPETRIELYLPAATTGSVRIFDIRGCMVADLHRGPLSQGQNTFVWTGRDNVDRAVASGVYFVRAQTADQKLTKKLLLVK
ncbi:MAG: FlgD immunoglobulin-like domain containing protein [Gammaproteobacteria bacterium]|nr:FlgD immunoglobulin-like domain containing protein [Gammaproteobacteria bacterium]